MILLHAHISFNNKSPPPLPFPLSFFLIGCRMSTAAILSCDACDTGHHDPPTVASEIDSNACLGDDGLGSFNIGNVNGELTCERTIAHDEF